jgi:hypothetical protein
VCVDRRDCGYCISCVNLSAYTLLCVVDFDAVPQYGACCIMCLVEFSSWQHFSTLHALCQGACLQCKAKGC